MNAQHAFSDWNQLRFRGNLNASANTSNSVTAQQTLLPDGSFQNSASSRTGTDRDQLNGDGRLTFSKRFNQAGRSIVAEAWGELSEPDQLTNLNSTTQFADGQGGVTILNILQNQLRESQTFTTGQRLGFTEPLGKGNVVELYGQHRAIAEDQNYVVNDLVGGTSVPNTDLSRAFERTYSYLQGGTRFSRTRALRWVSASRSDVRSFRAVTAATIDRNVFTNVLPSANVR